MIEFTFTLSESEYLEAQSLYMAEQHTKSRLKRWTLAGIIVSSLAGFTGTQPDPTTFFYQHAYLAGVLVMPFIFVFPQFFLRLAFKSRFPKEKQNLTDVHLRIDASGYRSEVPGIGAGIAEWAGFSVWYEGKNVFLLRSGLLMRILPKASLTESQLNEVRGLLTTHIGPIGMAR